MHDYRLSKASIYRYLNQQFINGSVLRKISTPPYREIYKNPHGVFKRNEY